MLIFCDSKYIGNFKPLSVNNVYEIWMIFFQVFSVARPSEGVPYCPGTGEYTWDTQTPISGALQNNRP
jgi:hypothetical protein